MRNMTDLNEERMYFHRGNQCRDGALHVVSEAGEEEQDLGVNWG